MIKERINRWLNNGAEKRAGYTDLITQTILPRTNSIDTIYSGALEIAAGTVSCAIASAVPTGAEARYFTSTVMGEGVLRC